MFILANLKAKLNYLELNIMAFELNPMKFEIN